MTDIDDTETQIDFCEQRGFAEYDAANPEIWRLFVDFTFDRVQSGFKHYGARDILHRIRWDTETSESGPTGLKINNIWSPYYARKFHRMFPQHAGFFRVRASKADEA